MLSFAFPYAFLLLPVPWLVWKFAPAHREKASALRVPFFHSLAEAAGQTPSQGAMIRRRGRGQMLAAMLCWGLTVTGLARPEILGEPVVIEKAARDLVLAVDISGSMDTRDLQDADGNPVQRLDAVRDVINGFIAERDGDRIALIVFGTNAYLQTPFTEDLASAAELMAQTEVGMAGPHTAMGDAIGLALRTFEASDVEQKLLVLLSDGADTNSQMSPLNATEIAAGAGVRIFTIGVGDPQASGENRVDLATLKAIAERADGEFYTASDTEGLRAIYDEIDALNPRLVETTTFQPKETRGHLAFAVAVLVGLGTLAGLVAGQRMGTADG
ncbi:VWA domain-containing protein [Roseobacter sp.]|uniref:VWA domain-containing protein n=1 Tax=Roseobacter sp. TaxID=1907202 RepID=UPI0025D67CE4|nr:VWA domain-containing protein [Roseobacter sp.]